MRGIDRDPILLGIGQPAAAAAARHVDRDHPAAALDQGSGEKVEVVGIACEPVYAHHGPGGGGLAPIQRSKLEPVEVGAEREGFLLHEPEILPLAALDRLLADPARSEKARQRATRAGTSPRPPPSVTGRWRAVSRQMV